MGIVPNDWEGAGGSSQGGNSAVGGGGALRFEKVPTAKRPHGAEAANAKIQGWLTPFGAK